jgi:hypothetical protein
MNRIEAGNRSHSLCCGLNNKRLREDYRQVGKLRVKVCGIWTVSIFAPGDQESYLWQD